MRSNCTLILCGLAASMVCTLAVWGQDETQTGPARRGAAEQSTPITPDMAQARFLAENPGADLYVRNGRITRVHGQAFSHGESPHDAAERFRWNHSSIWNVPPQDLVARGPFADGQHLQPIMFENGQYKFTGVYYAQQRGGVDVFRSRVMMLARNEPNYPVVLASADLRDIGNFLVDQAAVANANAAAGVAEARKSMPPGSIFGQATVVIFAGVDDQPHPPVLAVTFEGEGGNPLQNNYSKRLFVTDAVTGQVLHSESLVHEVDVTGTVQANSTENFTADICSNEVPMAMPYALVQIQGGSSAFANVNGAFTIPNAGSSSVTVNSPVSGQYFVVNNQTGGNSVVSQAVTPPGPLNILHNSANTSEFYRAEVNTYIHANIIRDLVLANNPAYPTIAGQTNFPINANINQSCNAFYNGTSINFYIQAGTCPNTGFGTVVHHEYGHHVVATGGSGQGAYGEGMSDCMGVLVTDGSLTGIGWGMNCGGGLRNANNNCQYQTTGCSSCGSAAHSCGQLISGCIWSLRNNLLATNPSTYRQILANLTVNSVLLHTGTSIAPDITIDFLTLDDNDGNPDNGTPHYNEIAQAFGAHNMPAPPLPLLLIDYPLGRPDYVNPNGTTILRATVVPNGQPLGPNPPNLNVNIGAGFAPVAMSLVGTNTYEAAFPAAPCGRAVRYYVSATTSGGTTITSPTGAPTAFFNAISANGLGTTTFDDNFQTNQGWTVATTATDGPWERAIPIPLSTCNRGNPGTDGDGSGFCYVTDNSSAGACNSDVDGGATVLTSPNMNATGQPLLAYWRWFSNVAGGAPNQDTFLVEISANGGTTWQTLEVVGPVIESSGGWFRKQFSLADIPGFPLTNQFRVRFTAQDTGTGSVVEAGIDGVKLQQLVCSGVVGDTDGDGDVDADDLVNVVLGWGPCPAPPATCAGDVDDDGDVDADDLVVVVLNWT